MNEEQRKASSVDVLAERDKKAEKDYSKYFEHVYQPPNLKEAKKEVNKKFVIIEISKLMKNIAVWGNERTFLIKTYGCQMNAHDTEVIAGILEALGYQATTDINTADVILINTCAIRENAENKVFSEIGNLKHLKKNDLIF